MPALLLRKVITEPANTTSQLDPSDVHTVARSGFPIELLFFLIWAIFFFATLWGVEIAKGHYRRKLERRALQSGQSTEGGDAEKQVGSSLSSKKKWLHEVVEREEGDTEAVAFLFGIKDSARGNHQEVSVGDHEDQHAMKRLQTFLKANDFHLAVDWGSERSTEYLGRILVKEGPPGSHENKAASSDGGEIADELPLPVQYGAKCFECGEEACMQEYDVEGITL